MILSTLNPEPLRLVTGDPVGGDPARQFWLLVGVLGVLFMLSSMGAMYLWWHRTISTDAQDFAFRTLARRLGVARRDRSAIRRLAKFYDHAPAALLVSPSAMRDAIETCAQRKDAGIDRASLDRLQDQLASAQ